LNICSSFAAALEQSMLRVWSNFVVLLRSDLDVQQTSTLRGFFNIQV
jgi:hypothetical protein